VLRGSFDSKWFADLGALLFAGIPAFEIDAANAANLNAERYAHDQPWAFYAVLLMLGIALAAGLWWLWKQRSLIAISFILASIGGLFCTVFVFMAKSLVLLTWYGVFMLPAALLLLAIGIDQLSKKHWVFSFVGAALLLAWLPATLNYGQHSRENLRGPIERAYNHSYPELLSHSVDLRMGCFWSNSPIYDPRIVPLWKADELQIMIDDARRNHHPLWIEYGFSANARQQQPELYALVNDPKIFQPIAIFSGLDYEMSTHQLFRLKDEP
jgi:hypothetical protein